MSVFYKYALSSSVVAFFLLALVVLFLLWVVVKTVRYVWWKPRYDNEAAIMQEKAMSNPLLIIIATKDSRIRHLGM
ncbi:unnamed protein product [Victoria cruziana]